MSSKALQQIVRRFGFPLWRWYFFGVIFLLLTTWTTVSIPRFSKQVVNAFLGHESENFILKLILTIISLGVLQILIRSLSRWLLFWPGRKVESDLKNYYFDHFLKLPLPFFHKFPQGDLISRLANDVTQIRVCFAFAVLQAANLVFLFSFAVYNMLQVSVHLTLITLVPLLLIIVVARISAPQVLKHSKMSQIKLGDLSNRLTETFLHIGIIQTNDSVESFLARAREKMQEVYQANVKLALVRTIMFPIATLFTGMSFLIVLYYGGMEIIHNKLSVGDILAFNIYIALLSFPLTAMGIIIAIVQRARSSCERLVELEVHKYENTRQDVWTEQKTPWKHPNGELFPTLLKVKNLSFAYGTEPVLKDISFEIFHQEKIGITGPIGSGKSTLLSLLTRLYEAAPSSIFFKGEDIQNFDPQYLRRKIGLCLQTPYFFSSSVYDNLTLGLDKEITFQSLEDSAAKAQILTEIRQLEQGWDTLVGERGVRLSGGQKQRLALSRLLLRKSELLLLDDITAAVDQTTELRLLSEIEKLSVSMIIVTHRPTALRLCKEVLLLDKGKLIDRGPYDVLLSKHPHLFESYVI